MNPFEFIHLCNALIHWKIQSIYKKYHVYHQWQKVLNFRCHWVNYKYRLLLQIWHKSSLWSKNKPHRIINVYCPSDSSHKMCKSSHKSPIRKNNRFVWTVQSEKVDKRVWNISIISGSWCETINLDSPRSSQFLCLWSSNFP